MSYKQYTIEDFVMDIEFRRWVLEPDKELNLFWENWLEDNPDKVEIIREAIEVIKKLPVEKHLLSPEEINTITQKIENEIDEFEQSNTASNGGTVIPLNADSIVNKKQIHVPAQRKSPRLIAAAASVILVLASAYLVYQKVDLKRSDEKTATSMMTKENPKGQKSNIFLSDGTKVILNAASKISYPKPFDPDKRIVRLEGEAFFEVAKEEDRPFQVITGDITTIALGTSFNINAYNNNEEIDIALTTGSVKVEGESNAREDKLSELLVPGEALIYNLTDKTTVKKKFDKGEVTAWQEGVIYFKNANENEVKKRLENWYGIEISFANTRSGSWDLTAKFDNQSLKDVLISLSYTMDFDFSIEEKKVMIRYR
ncbi:FecR domain-containing protein [Fulvivirgaceae bacterium BMA10]|uniref:FecR domain-containing protein n=1 Tax=Splendidivirga corallicola TaxID=3051826 RepID=A0ABT8KGN5_9BACT|nr:FecR domain-containing protein [Fulvivirgaceae bacterium BMA10]